MHPFDWLETWPHQTYVMRPMSPLEFSFWLCTVFIVKGVFQTTKNILKLIQIEIIPLYNKSRRALLKPLLQVKLGNCKGVLWET